MVARETLFHSLAFLLMTFLGNSTSVIFNSKIDTAWHQQQFHSLKMTTSGRNHCSSPGFRKCLSSGPMSEDEYESPTSQAFKSIEIIKLGSVVFQSQNDLSESYSHAIRPHRVLRISGGANAGENPNVNMNKIDPSDLNGNREMTSSSRSGSMKTPLTKITSKVPAGTIPQVRSDESLRNIKTPLTGRTEKHTVQGSEKTVDAPSSKVVSEAFGFYALLGVERNCDAADIRQAYKRLALAAHPDRHPNDSSAKARFQVLQSVYETLREPKRRRIYDESGGNAAMAALDDDTDGLFAAGGGFEAVLAHFRGLFRRANAEGVAQFEAEYRGSAMEEKDLEEHYRRRAGDVADLVAFIPYSEDEDMYRYKSILQIGQVHRDSKIPCRPPDSYLRPVAGFGCTLLGGWMRRPCQHFPYLTPLSASLRRRSAQRARMPKGRGPGTRQPEIAATGLLWWIKSARTSGGERRGERQRRWLWRLRTVWLHACAQGR
jgi:hypothetical protein